MERSEAREPAAVKPFRSFRKHPLPSPEELRRIIRYEPETGKLYRLPKEGKTEQQRSWNKRFAGREVGCAKPNGYKTVTLGGALTYAHRVAWAIHYGEWPKGLIDHINGVRTDNRIQNLRCVTYFGNSRNAAMNKKNSSGYNGVAWHKSYKKWMAYGWLNGKSHFLGRYACKEEAARVSSAWRTSNGFSDRHGLRMADDDK